MHLFLIKPSKWLFASYFEYVEPLYLNGRHRKGSEPGPILYIHLVHWGSGQQTHDKYLLNKCSVKTEVEILLFVVLGALSGPYAR